MFSPAHPSGGKFFRRASDLGYIQIKQKSAYMPDDEKNRSGMRIFREINIDKTVSQWYNRC